MTGQKQRLQALFSGITDYFSPRIIGEVNDMYVKLVKFKGQDVPWHTHENEDELFFIVKGRATIEQKGFENMVLNEGELLIVGKGVEHRVHSDEECWMMLVEQKTTAHTGKVKSHITKTVDEQHY